LREELGLEAQIGAYLGVVEHSYGDEKATHYELNHLFEVSLPTLAEGEKLLSREAHLTFFWAKRVSKTPARALPTTEPP
jgi:8-oxo-dGTP diphosphatase